jgi:L,D-transpeptidase YcbB
VIPLRNDIAILIVQQGPGAVTRFLRVSLWGLWGLSFLAVLIASNPARAQDWWEDIPGFSFPNNSSGPERRPPPSKTVELNDLRPDDIPWRSDEMLSAIDKAIAKYQAITNRGGWPTIAGNRMLRRGDSDQRVGTLRRRLRTTGDLSGGASYGAYDFDARVEAGVIRFQRRHGLRASGRVDRRTLAVLNVPADERLAQLKLNRSRLVQLVQTPPEERYVLVNVPAFQLEAVERYQTVLRHRVIVGRPDRETPSLKATIKGVNFFPYWKVPDSVARLDVIPRLQKEPDYLQKEQIRVLVGNFNGRELDPASIDWTQASVETIKFRQDPGPQNALGLVRIDMQNEHGVYMHDTPMKPLFKQRGRAFSAGCVRIQDVFELVDWLVGLEPGWTQRGRVQSVLQDGQAVDVEFTRPVPVYFAYITAWAEAKGRVEFRPDIYQRDGSRAVAGVFDPDAPPPPQSGLAP